MRIPLWFEKRTKGFWNYLILHLGIHDIRCKQTATQKHCHILEAKIEILQKQVNGICEVKGCIRPASIFVRDVKEVEPKHDNWKEFEADETTHKFCEEHQRDSMVLMKGRRL